MDLEQMSLDFINKLQRIYYEERDMDAVCEAMEEGISLLVSDKYEMCEGREKVRQLLYKEKKRRQENIEILFTNEKALVLSDEMCLVYGEIEVRPDHGAGVRRKRTTFLCRRKEDRMYLCHLHISDIDEKREMRACLNELKELTGNIPGGMHQCLNDSGFTLINVSDSFTAIFGYSREEIKECFQNRYIDMIYPDDRARIMQDVKRQLFHGNSVELEYRVLGKDKKMHWILDKGSLVQSHDGQQSLYCVLIDITERRKEKEQLRLSLERHKVIMDQGTDIIFEWDIIKDTLEFSANWRKKFGYAPIKTDVSSRISESKNIYPDDMPQCRRIIEDIAGGLPYGEMELRIRDRMGNYNWFLVRATTQYDINNCPIKSVGVIVDIDNFKKINDTYGHLCGDAVISDMAAGLKKIFGESGAVGRIGGDEFLAFVPSIQLEEAHDYAKRVLKSICGIKIKGKERNLSGSIGIACYPKDGKDYINLFRLSDSALYHVKNTTKGGYCFYKDSLSVESGEKEMERSAVGSIIDSDEIGSVNEKLAQYSFYMLYSSTDIKDAVNQLLEIIGRAYDVSRVYIFESSEDGMFCSNTFEWCNEGVTSEIDNLQDLSYKEDLGDYISKFNKDGVFHCRDIKELDSNLYRILSSQGVVSMVQCAILDNGEFKGYMGFDECRESRS